jgi:hypothetical protein
METTTLDQDIKIFYMTAKSFPEGVLEAHQKLHALIPYSTERRYFGLSRPENGTILYKAAAEEMQPGEAEKLKCDTLTIKKGSYISITIPDFMNDIPAIQRTFNQLLSQPGLDPQGYCVEEYINEKDMICMVRLNN